MLPSFQSPITNRDGGSYVSSGWGSDRTGASGRPAGVAAIHNGIDFPAPIGTPVRAAASGQVVTVADWGVSGGKAVVVEHGGGARSRYLHLDEPLVAVGNSVAAGQVIARSGETGTEGLPHLHFDLRVPNTLVGEYIAKFGAPHDVPFPGDFVSGGYGIPAEPLVPVNLYSQAVKNTAARYGIPLYRQGGWLVLAVIVGGLTAGYFLSRRR